MSNQMITALLQQRCLSKKRDKKGGARHTTNSFDNIQYNKYHIFLKFEWKRGLFACFFLCSSSHLCRQQWWLCHGRCCVYCFSFFEVRDTLIITNKISFLTPCKKRFFWHHCKKRSFAPMREKIIRSSTMSVTTLILCQIVLKCII